MPPAPAIDSIAPPATYAVTDEPNTPMVAAPHGFTPASLTVTTAPMPPLPASEVPSQQSRSARNKTRGKKRKALPSGAVPAPPATLPETPAAPVMPAPAIPAPAVPAPAVPAPAVPAPAVPPPASQISPRKTRSVRKKENGPSDQASTQAVRGKKRKQGETEDALAGVEPLNGRKKSKFWTYEIVPSTSV
ncbi:hypothetical protein F5880DRAFT_1617667 [Lentinula raphanica]|nr:hypothetical protein F5880DRAFT_1617667 [Lentinula raphanica]